MSDAEGVKALVDEIDMEMSKKSFKFFFIIDGNTFRIQFPGKRSRIFTI